MKLSTRKEIFEKYKGADKDLVAISDKCFKDVVSQIQSLDKKHDFSMNDLCEVFDFIFGSMYFLSSREVVTQLIASLESKGLPKEKKKV